MTAQAVLFDVPGPRAQRINTIVGAVGGALLLGGVGVVVWGTSHR